MIFSLKKIFLSCALLGFIMSASASNTAPTTTTSESELRLYALNCGEFTDPDLASFSDAGVYPQFRNF